MMDEELLAMCNEYFGVEIAMIDWPYIYDIYYTKDEFSEEVGEPFEVLEKAGTAVYINDVYIFLNECNVSDYYVGCSLEL